MAGLNSLLDTDFNLSKEWSPSNGRGPETYLKTNKSWVYWLCPACSGEYRCPINEREVGDDSCPYCNDRRTLAGLNSLADTHEELVKEWRHNNVQKPTEVRKSNALYVLWFYPTCHGEYSYPIKEREVGDDSLSVL